MHNSFLIFLLMIVSPQLLAQQSSLEFRDDFRPTFSNTVTVDKLKQKLSSGDVIVIDVRLEEDFIKDPNLIPGAVRQNPESLQQWISTLNKDDEVVVYCVAVKWVSNKVAFLLDQAGVPVQSLVGGITAWQQAPE